MDLSGNEIVLLFARWIHAISAVAWIGGSIVFAAVLRPVSKAQPEVMGALMPRIARYYRDVVDISVVAIIISGLLLTLDRLTEDAATASYGVVLGVKLALAGVMFYQMWNLRQSKRREPESTGLRGRISWMLGYNALIALGVVVYFLANLLAILFDDGLRAVG